MTLTGSTSKDKLLSEFKKNPTYPNIDMSGLKKLLSSLQDDDGDYKQAEKVLVAHDQRVKYEEFKTDIHRDPNILSLDQLRDLERWRSHYEKKNDGLKKKIEECKQSKSMPTIDE